MNKILLLLLLLVSIMACEEKPKPKPVTVEEVAHDIGKQYRSLKDAFREGYQDTIKKDTLPQ